MTTLMHRHDNHQPDKTSDGEQWFGGRRWTGIAALAVLLVVAVCVAIVLITRPGRSSSAPTVDAAAPSGSVGDQPASTTLTASAAVPTAAPEPTTWTVFDTVALPSVPGQGPRHVARAVATGYAHTPTGALLAAVNEDYRIVLADDRQDWRAAADAMLAPDPVGTPSSRCGPGRRNRARSAATTPRSRATSSCRTPRPTR